MVPAHGLPLLLHVGLEVSLVPPALKGPRSHIVRSVKDTSTGQLVLLSQVHSIGDAAQLVGKLVLARVSDLPEDLALHDVDALLGREVRDDTHGVIGEVVEVMRGPANDVWVVQGDVGEVLVPVVDVVVESVPSHGPIDVRLPTGLVSEEV